MPVNNNNQKVEPNAAARIVKLPVVRSACATLSVLYRDAKSSSSSLKSLCEALESGVTALSTAACTRASPVIVKLEPQISIANNFACKGLDWLETSFPVVLSPPDEVVASAKSKVNEIRDVVTTAAGGTVVTVQHTVAQVISRLHQADNSESQSMVKRAISMASMGLDSALTMSEALVDQVLPPPEEERVGEEPHSVEGFEASVRSGSYSGRLMKLAAKVCWRTYQMIDSKIHFVQITERLSKPTTLVQNLQKSWQTLVRSLHGLPQYFQHQVVSVFHFFSQMYNLSISSSRREHTRRRIHVGTAEGSPLSKELGRSPALRLRPTRTSVFENGCLVKGCVRH